MISEYKIILEQDGENHVKVLLRTSRTDYQLVWSFTLEGDDEPIVLSQFYSPVRFAVVNWDGWVRICDISSREIIFSDKLELKIDARAVFSPDFQNLYVVGSADRETFFTAYSLGEMPEKTAQVNINRNAYAGFLQARKDGNLLFYYNNHERTDTGKVFNHGYYLADFQQGHLIQNDLPNPALTQFDKKEPLVVAQANLGFMPSWEQVRVIVNDLGEEEFEYSAVAFTLDTFEIIRKIPVRTLKQSELAYYEIDKEMAEYSKSGEWNEDHRECLEEFYSTLRSMVYDEKSHAIWMCWEGGVLVRLDLTDFSVSPALAIASLPDSRTEGAFNFPQFQPEIYEAGREYLLLNEADKLYELSLTGLDLRSPCKYLEVHLSSFNMNIIAPTEVEKAEKYRSKNIIEVKDLLDEDSVHDALNQIQLISRDIDNARKGDTLAFAVKDSKGKVLLDDQFFELAARVDQGLEKIALTVRQFAAYPKASQLYINEEETALCYANLELAKAGPEHLEDVYEYLAAIDDGHDVFNRETLMLLLAEKYADTVHMKSIVERLTEISETWAECLEGWLVNGQ